MTDIAIQVQGLGKRYTIGGERQPYRTLRESITGLFRPRPAAPDKTFWALKDVTFTINRGEVVGIIGRNGAGKSTLLKVLSRITEPTEGGADINGRVGSLLEVGTGFHPELTGRENVYLNGAILGMHRAEIAGKFDEIVAFAETEKFLDTPVKFYSSGMYTRLAFAVAAHLDPEILIVDEVLAVGDAAFQRKCLGRMGEVAQLGRTVVFVSHNMSAVTALCRTAVLMRRGRVQARGTAAEMAALYQAESLNDLSPAMGLRDVRRTGTGRGRFAALSTVVVDAQGRCRPDVPPHTGCDLRITVDVETAVGLAECNVAVIIYDGNGYRLVDANSAIHGRFLSLPAGGRASVTFDLANVLLKPDTYLVGLWLGRAAIEAVDDVETAGTITMAAPPAGARHTEVFPGPYQCSFTVAGV